MYALRIRYALACILIAIGTILPITAQEPVTLRVMIHKTELTDEQISAFEDENPDIKIERLNADTFELNLALSTGEMPDVLRLGSNQIPALVDRGALLDLTEYFQTSSLIDFDDLTSASEYYRIDEHYYGLPKDWSPDFTIWVYETAFEEAGVVVPSPDEPLTYAEFASIARDLTIKEGDNVIRPGLFIFYYLNTITQILIQHNTTMFNDDFSELQLTSNPIAMEVVRFFYDMSLEGSLNLDNSLIMEAWGEGLPMVQFGYWYGGSIAQDSPLHGHLTMLPAPTWDSNLPRVSPTGGPTGLAISANTAYPEEAYRFFEWYIVGLEGRERARHGWGAPPLLSMFELLPQDTPSNQQRFNILMEEVPYSNWQLPIYPYLSTMSAFDEAWQRNIKLAVSGQIDFETFASNIQEEVNLAILNEQLGQ